MRLSTPPVLLLALLAHSKFTLDDGNVKLRSLVLVPVLSFTTLAIAADSTRVSVKVVNRKDTDTDYSYQIPGHATSSSDINSNCLGSGSDVNCSGSGQINTVITAPRSVYMHLTGATFTLLLTDGRMAVVNCESKFQERFAGLNGNRRSCRVPLVDDLQAEFKGNGVKLFWPVSLDGKKVESETYKVLAVVPAQQQAEIPGNPKQNSN